MPQPVVAVPDHLPTVAATATASPFDPSSTLAEELDRQVDVVLALGVAEVLGLTADDVRREVAPLRAALARTDVPVDARAVEREDHVPLVLVLRGGTDHLVDVVPAMRHGGPGAAGRGRGTGAAPRHGVTVMPPDELAAYAPLDDVHVPAGAYLLLDVDTGGDLRSTPPETALAEVRRRGRTPLTATEGVHLVVVRPDVLRPNRCFSLMGARAAGQRVPAVWISERRAKLGWCWDRNPHTWLGAAHAALRLDGQGLDGPGLDGQGLAGEGVSAR